VTVTASWDALRVLLGLAPPELLPLAVVLMAGVLLTVASSRA
jgi:hypothetical protein